MAASSANARQGDLFAADPASLAAAAAPAPELPLLEHQLRRWQERLGAFQAPLFEGVAVVDQPQTLALLHGIGMDPQLQAQSLDPLSLRAQHLQFWRWPTAALQGAAIYLVMDRPGWLEQPLLLYVGETAHADRRWKGEHDCKGYLAAYGEALNRAGMESCLSIRFWSDVPVETRPRRALEQALIRRWQPPFNKETRQRWATPFTADSD